MVITTTILRMHGRRRDHS